MQSVTPQSLPNRTVAWWRWRTPQMLWRTSWATRCDSTPRPTTNRRPPLLGVGRNTPKAVRRAPAMRLGRHREPQASMKVRSRPRANTQGMRGALLGASSWSCTTTLPIISTVTTSHTTTTSSHTTTPMEWRTDLTLPVRLWGHRLPSRAASDAHPQNPLWPVEPNRRPLRHPCHAITTRQGTSPAW